MTEDEAKTKFCCGPQVMARAMMSNDGSLEYRCIGSACMAWRWFESHGETKIDAIKRHRDEHGSTLYDAKTYVEAHPEYLRAGPPERGFCGLAGRP